MRFDRPIAPELLAALPCLPCDGDGPIFTGNWQLRAFALVVNLCEQGHFTWREWVTALSNEIGATGTRKYDPDEYYRHWLEAMERLLTTKGLVDADSVQERMRTLAEGAEPRPGV